MARTITEISDEIKQRFVHNSVLRTLYGIAETLNPLNVYNLRFKEVSIETQLITIVAVVIASLENMFDWLKADVEKAINEERYGHVGWYQKMALLFRYGQDINSEYSPNSTSDFAESTVYSDDGLSESQIKELQIVKYAFAADRGDFGVLLKITGGTQGNFTMLEPEQQEVFEAYINRIKPAGIPVEVRNMTGDQLFLKLWIQYNPLILDTSGKRISDNTYPVEDAINSYLNAIEFNGEFVKMKLVDTIQAVEGVEIVENTYAAQISGTAAVEAEIVAKHSPYAGYMRLSGLEITYVVA
jgi:hypothetical protein